MQLVIAEKPSVGVALAKALGVTNKKDGYIEGNGYIVSWCVGHLVSLANADMYDEKFKKWDIVDLPIIPDEWQFIIENLYQSALCRAKADWIVGINATRLFSKLYNRTLNVGRVQTPTLAMLYERENSISNFQKEKYFNVHLKSVGLDAVHEKIKEQGEAENIRRDCDGKEAIVKSVKTERKTVNTPHFYDLTTLQREANRLYGYPIFSCI